MRCSTGTSVSEAKSVATIAGGDAVGCGFTGVSVNHLFSCRSVFLQTRQGEGGAGEVGSPAAGFWARAAHGVRFLAPMYSDVRTHLENGVPLMA